MLHFIAFKVRDGRANVSEANEPGPTLGKKTPPPGRGGGGKGFRVLGWFLCFWFAQLIPVNPKP